MGSTEHNPYWLSWIWKSADDPHALATVQRYLRRPSEELYDTQSDPLELRNCINDPRQAANQSRLAAELDRWMRGQGDPGAGLDTTQAQQKHRAALKAAANPPQ